MGLQHGTKGSCKKAYSEEPKGSLFPLRGFCRMLRNKGGCCVVFDEFSISMVFIIVSEARPVITFLHKLHHTGIFKINQFSSVITHTTAPWLFLLSAFRSKLLEFTLYLLTP